MRVFVQIFRHFIAEPTMEARGGKPVAKFNRFQFWAYPELCREQLREALSHCDEHSRQSQLAVAQAYFGGGVTRA
jgi:hypothetical protein